MRSWPVLFWLSSRYLPVQAADQAIRLNGRIDAFRSPGSIDAYALQKGFTKDAQKRVERMLAIKEIVEYDFPLLSQSAKNEVRFLEIMNDGPRRIKKYGNHRLVNHFVKPHVAAAKGQSQDE